MLKAMAEQSPDAARDVTQDFLTTGRVGRRNALPDILGEHALTTTSELPDRFKSLSTAGEPPNLTDASHPLSIVCHCPSLSICNFAKYH
jgi:hypothetical protein